MNEVDKIKNGYWLYSSAGLPIPGFVFDILPDKTYRNRFAAWLARFDSRQAIVAFYIESKFREAGCIATMADLGDWCRLAEGASPELSTSADAIKQNYLAAQKMVNSEQQEEQKKKEDRLATVSDATRIKRELIAKNLPTGKHANLALMRAIVKRVDPETRSEQIVDPVYENFDCTAPLIVAANVNFLLLYRGGRCRKVHSIYPADFKRNTRVDSLSERRMQRSIHRCKNQLIHCQIITRVKCSNVDGVTNDPPQCTKYRVVRRQHGCPTTSHDQRSLVYRQQNRSNAKPNIACLTPSKQVLSGLCVPFL